MPPPDAAAAAGAWSGLAEPGSVARLRAALSGLATERVLRIGALQPADVGVLEATVRAVSPVKTFRRPRGGEGLLARVTLADATGEVELVLWDQETQRLAAEFQPGARVRLRGPSVKAGYRDGVELGLGSCQVEVLTVPGQHPGEALEGQLALGTLGSGDGGRRADASVAGQRVALSGALLEQALALEAEGARVRLGPVTPHPVLPGWWLVGPRTVLARANGDAPDRPPGVAARAVPPADNPK